MSTRTIVDPTAALLGREPELAGIDYVEPGLRRQRFRTEAWDLTDGTRVVIVTESGGTSLHNRSPSITAAIIERWEHRLQRGFEIIEDWGDLLAGSSLHGGGARFLYAPMGQAPAALDHDHWDSRGLVLPRRGH